MKKIDLVMDFAIGSDPLAKLVSRIILEDDCDIEDYRKSVSKIKEDMLAKIRQEVHSSLTGKDLSKEAIETEIDNLFKVDFSVSESNKEVDLEDNTMLITILMEDQREGLSGFVFHICNSLKESGEVDILEENGKDYLKLLIKKSEEEFKIEIK